VKRVDGLFAGVANGALTRDVGERPSALTVVSTFSANRADSVEKSGFSDGRGAPPITPSGNHFEHFITIWNNFYASTAASF
jgi:hypothetical protein